MMEEFKYKVSVIVPVYNVEKYLRDCLDSLAMQTIPQEEMEVLLINDGSTDGSLDICKEYIEIYDNFKLFSKENEGLSATRNFGIKRAQGKYLMYIDSDDMFSPDTVQEVTDFFDTVYSKVDLVTFKDQPYKNGKKMEEHYRYKYLKKSGIYDLGEYPYICQTRVNICVKNRMEDNVLFDTTPDFRHEDMAYCSQVLKDKQKIGFCAKGEYMYNKNNETSLMNTYFYPYYIFETTMKYWEDLFGQFENEIPGYYQNLFINDISWKLQSNILFPYHYQSGMYQKAVSRIVAILDKMDADIILNSPSTDNFHKHYFLNMKSDAGSYSVIAEKNGVSVFDKNKLLYRVEKFEIILHKVRIVNHHIKMLAFVKSPLFNYMEKPVVQVVVTDWNNKENIVEQDTFLSGYSYYKTKEKTNNFWAFEFEYDAEQIWNYRVQIVVDGFTYPTYYWFMPSAPYSNIRKNYRAIYKDYVVDFKNNNFYVKKSSAEQIAELRKAATEILSDRKAVYNIRLRADSMTHRRIWLYYDCRGVAQDNAWYQFQYDFEMRDGIDRYYINANEGRSFSEEYKENIIEFGGTKHKILYVSAEKILTAYIEAENTIPFDKEERAYFADIAHPEVIYLQHGILHAHVPWKYAPGCIEADKIVISSRFEAKNFVETYHFRKQILIPVGMPRFDLIRQDMKPVNRILFAPSWRNYLIGTRNGNAWNLTVEKFRNSNYFRVFHEFLNSEQLEQVLEKHDMYLDFKIHPIFKPYLHLFEQKNARVCFADWAVRDEEYAMFITDFSSYVFDFGYLRRPILYFVPDWIEFISGMNQYRELDLPFEKAFGPLVTNVDDAVREIADAAENGFQTSEVYRQRMDDFYLPLKSCRENLYRALID